MEHEKFLYLTRSDVAACNVSLDESLRISEETYAELKGIRLHADRTKKNVHPLFLGKGGTALLQLINIHMGHLNGLKLHDLNGRGTLLAFSFVLHICNPVNFDTRDGCTWLGAGMGAMHLFFTDQTDPSDTRIPPPPCVHRG